jgi:hypothetical protein
MQLRAPGTRPRTNQLCTCSRAASVSSDPQERGGQCRPLRCALPRLSVVGRCCGTDHRHVAAIGRALAAGQAKPRGGFAG